MATSVVISIGSRTSDSVTVNTVTTTTVSGHTNAWSVVLSTTVPSTTKIGDKLTTSARDYLITNISGSTLTVVGDPFTTTAAPSTGSGATTRAFPSITTWAAGAPASLVTADWVWNGKLYQEGAGTNGEWTATASSTFSQSCNASCFFLLEAAAGQSFKDNASKLTNALRYNPANGVAVSWSAGTILFAVGAASTTGRLDVSGLQFQGPTTTGGDWLCNFNASERVLIKDCVLSRAVVRGWVYCTNVVAHVNKAEAFYRSQDFNGGNTFINCTLYGNGTDVAINSRTNDVNFIVRNCAIFNFTGIAATVSSITSASSTYNATDLASYGWSATGNLVSKTASNQFTALTGGSEDFRIKAGADVINAGVRDQTYTNDLDIVGTTRSLTTPTIGAWEYPTVTYTYARPASDITTQWTPSTGTDHYALIDETTANDADYISATAAGQTDEVRLASMTAPQAGTDLLINYRVQGIVGSASVTVSLVCNTTVHATDTTRTDNGDYTLTVPSGTWASVADWTNMRLRFVSA